VDCAAGEVGAPGLGGEEVNDRGLFSRSDELVDEREAGDAEVCLGNGERVRRRY